jgi:hypothetical protein
MFTATMNKRSYEQALLHPELELRDVCDLAAHDGLARVAEGFEFPEVNFDIAHQESEDFKFAATQPVGTTIIGGGVVLKKVKGMGTVYDWRKSPWTPANGGKIKPLVFVQHIPVVPNLAGIADFVRLRDVLVAQGLMVQNATDRDGNVALFTPMDVLCYQAKGANQQSCGTEHMHMSVGEEWTRRQLRASAWLINQAKEKHGLPAHMGALGNGPGIVKVIERGQVSHMRVSQAAGYNDRTDPGQLYDWEYVNHCVIYYRVHGHFEGA